MSIDKDAILARAESEALRIGALRGVGRQPYDARKVLVLAERIAEKYPSFADDPEGLADKALDDHDFDFYHDSPRARERARAIADERTRTAYHEAGHIVAAVLLRAGARNARLTSNRSGNTRGRGTRATTPVGRAKHVLKARQVAVAGIAAEMGYCYGRGIPWKQDEGATGDVEVFAEIGGKPDDPQEVLAVGRLLASHWQAVEAVATVLLKEGRIEAKDVRVAIERSGGPNADSP